MTYSSNIQNNGTSYQTTKASTSSGINSSPQSNNSTTGLYKGQQLSGEVMDLRNDEVTVRLQDGRILNGKMEDISALSIGDKVVFRVLDVSGSNLTLKLISDNANSSLGQILDKALDLAGLSKNPRNKAVVSELLKQQMPVDKNTINMLIKQSMTFKDTPISTLVLLNKYQLPVTKENLKLFEEYEKNAHNIYNDLEDMANSITDLFKAGNVTEEAYIKESKLLLQTLFSGKGEVLGTTNSLINQFPLSDDILPAPSVPYSNTVKPATNEVTGNVITDNVKQNLLAQANLNQHELNHINVNSQQVTEADKVPENLSKQDLNFLDYLKNNGFTPESINAVGSNSELLSFLSNHLDSLDAKIVKSLLNNSDFKELLKDELLSRWSLSPNDFANKELVDNHFESLVKDIKNISSSLEQTAFINGAKVHGQASNLMDNLNFMNQLNHIFAYIQIPIKLNTGYTKSELYVYSKRKRTVENDSSVSVLLHLDMNNLGPLDIYLKLFKNELESTFYCDNSNIMSVISNHIDTLTNTLTEKGFQLTTSVQARNKTVNVIKEILSEESADTFGVRYNFDVRA